MSKSGGFSVSISAQDRASATIDKINKRLERASAPVTRLGKSFDRLAKNVGFSDTLRGVRTLRRELAGAAGAMGQLGGGFGGLLGAGSLAGAAALANRYANVGSNLFLMARQARTSVPHLQRLQNAAALAGGSAEGAGQAFVELQNNLQNMAAGRNPAAMAAFNTLREHVNWGGPGHALPADQVMGPLLHALAATRNLSKQKALGEEIFGAGGYAAFKPMLIQGTQKLDQFNRAGAAMVPWTNREARNARMLQEGIRRLAGDVENTAYAAAGQFAPAATHAANAMAAWIEKNQHAAQSLAAVGIEMAALMAIRPATWLRLLLGIGSRAAPAAAIASVLALHGDTGPVTQAQRMRQLYEDMPDLPAGRRRFRPSRFPPTARAPRATMAQASKYFMAQGWTPAQTAGILSNISAESGFNPRKIGDYGTSFGLFQFHAGRAQLFSQWLRQTTGGRVTDPRNATTAQQLAFTQWELTKGDQRGAGAALRKANSPQAAGAVFSHDFERPANGTYQAMSRGAAATLFMPSVPSAQTHTVKGAAHVHINLAGAPPGTRVSAHTEGGLFTGAPRVTMPMPPGGGPT